MLHIINLITGEIKDNVFSSKQISCENFLISDTFNLACWINTNNEVVFIENYKKESDLLKSRFTVKLCAEVGFEGTSVKSSCASFNFSKIMFLVKNSVFLVEVNLKTWEYGLREIYKCDVNDFNVSVTFLNCTRNGVFIFIGFSNSELKIYNSMNDMKVNKKLIFSDPVKNMLISLQGDKLLFEFHGDNILEIFFMNDLECYDHDQLELIEKEVNPNHWFEKYENKKLQIVRNKLIR
jgi:hypothetical protein